MTESNQCFVTDCHRGALASVTRPDLPGSLRLCATHTEQFRQSSEGWGITWPADQPLPTSVTAPSSEQLWAYRPEPGTRLAEVEPSTPPPSSGRTGLPGRAASWLEARRSGRRQPPQ